MAITVLKTGLFTAVLIYHRSRPKFSLPDLKPTKLPQKDLFCGRSVPTANEIFSTGFDVTKSSKHSLLGKGVYLTPKKETASAYGKAVVVVSLDLKEDEIAYLDSTALVSFQHEHREELVKEGSYAHLPKLFRDKGYKALQYDLYDWKRGITRPEKAWIVYDPSCIKVKEVITSS